MAGYLLIYAPSSLPSTNVQCERSRVSVFYFILWNLHMQDEIAESATLLLTEYNVGLLPVFYPPLRAIY